MAKIIASTKEEDSKLTALDQAIGQIEKQFGKGAIMRLGDDSAKVKIDAISTGSIELDIALGIGGVPRGRVSEIYGPESAGKCLTEDTYIATEKEGYLTIKEIFNKNGLKTFCVNKTTEVQYSLFNMDMEPESTTYFTHNGKRKILKLTTRTGNIIKGTANHPLRVMSKAGNPVWRNIKDIKQGNYLLCQRRGFFGENNYDSDFMYAIGVLLADGSFQKNRICITNDDPDIQDFIEKKLSLILGVNNMTKYPRGDKGGFDYHFSNKEKIDIFYRKFGFSKCVSKGKIIPGMFRGADKKSLIFLIQGYMDCESFCASKKGIEVCSASFDLLFQLKLILSQFGIISFLKEKKVKSYEFNEYWRLTITGKDCVKYIIGIGSRSGKVKKRYEQFLKARVENSQLQTNHDTIPHLNFYIEDLYNNLVDSNRNRETNKSYFDYKGDNYKANITTDTLKKLCILSEPSFIKTYFLNLVENEFYFDRVDKVELLFESPTFDFAMAKTHSFIANSIISHNTTLMLHVIAQAQKAGGIAAFVDAEHALDPSYAAKLGVDTDKLLVSQPSCISNDSIILTPRGPVICRDLIPGEKIISFNEELNKYEEERPYKFGSGIKKSFDVFHSLGICKTTEEHKYKTFDRGYRPLKELKVGDYIGVPQKTNIFKQTEKILSRDDSIMLGLLIADGCYTKNHIKFTKLDKGILGWIQNYIENNFKDTLFKKISSSEKDYTFIKKISNSHANTSFSIFAHKYLGFAKGCDKFIPEEIFKNGNGALAGMVCGLWSSDGSYNKKRGCLEYTTISENIVYSIMAILQHFGIPFTYCTRIDRRKSTYKILHRLSICAKEGLGEFKKKIGTIGRIKINDGEIHKKDSFVKFPKEIWPVIFLEIKNRFDSIVEYYNYLFDSKFESHRFNAKREVSLEYLIFLNSKLNSNVLDDLIKENIQYVKIRKICPRGEERTYDFHLPNNHNFICNNALVHNSGEEALEITEALVRSGAIDILVVDSVAALVPKAEIDGEMGDSHMGLQARLMSQALRKLTGVVSKSKTSVIFINQIRHKIGVMFGSPETTAGGNALKFYASTRMDIRKIEVLKQGDDAIGTRVRVKVVKNKCSPPFKQAEFDIMFGTGISVSGGLIDAASKYGIITKNGAWFNYGEERIGQGREKAKQYLIDNPKIASEIEIKIKEYSGIYTDGGEAGREAIKSHLLSYYDLLTEEGEIVEGAENKSLVWDDQSYNLRQLSRHIEKSKLQSKLWELLSEKINKEREKDV